MARIETGVDKLVDLVAKEKKIELEKAAKELSVDPAVVREWAEFLEEEGVLGIQYSLSKTFLTEKRMSSSEVEKKGKEYENKKEAFVRKVDAAIKHLEEETAGFESIKKQYDAVKDQIGDEIEAVKEEMEQLRHYEELKKSMDGDILKQKVEYQKTVDEFRQRLSSEEKRYEHLVSAITAEEKKVGDEQREFADIRKEEDDLSKRIEALSEIVKSVKGRLENQGKAVAMHEDRLQTLRELAEKLREDLLEKRRKEIEPMLKISDDQSDRIMRIQEEIVEKIKSGRNKIHEFEEEAHEIASRFEKFFEKRTKTESLIRELEELKQEMKSAMEDLILKAKGYDIASGKADVDQHIRELEKKFKDAEKKKSAFTGKLDQLRSFITGKSSVRKPDPSSSRKSPKGSGRSSGASKKAADKSSAAASRKKKAAKRKTKATRSKKKN